MNWLNANTIVALAVLLCRMAISITGVVWLIAGDKLRLIVAVIALLLTALPACAIREPYLRRVTAIIVAVLLAAHIVLGMQMELYAISDSYDKAMHALGSGAIAGILIIAVHTYCSQCGIDLPLRLLVLLVFAGTLSAGALWEIFEFAIDRTGLFNAQRGLRDTMLDLLADAIGAGLAISAFAAATCIKATVVASRWQLPNVFGVRPVFNRTRTSRRLAEASLRGRSNSYINLLRNS